MRIYARRATRLNLHALPYVTALLWLFEFVLFCFSIGPELLFMVPGSMGYAYITPISVLFAVWVTGLVRGLLTIVLVLCGYASSLLPAPIPLPGDGLRVTVYLFNIYLCFLVVWGLVHWVATLIRSRHGLAVHPWDTGEPWGMGLYRLIPRVRDDTIVKRFILPVLCMFLSYDVTHIDPIFGWYLFIASICMGIRYNLQYYRALQDVLLIVAQRFEQPERSRAVREWAGEGERDRPNPSPKRTRPPQPVPSVNGDGAGAASAGAALDEVEAELFGATPPTDTHAVTCPSCGVGGKVPVARLGTSVTCPKCRTRFVAGL